MFDFGNPLFVFATTEIGVSTIFVSFVIETEQEKGKNK